MKRKGWTRLWVVGSGVWLVTVGAVFAYQILGVDTCYSFISISTADSISAEDRDLVEHIRGDSKGKAYCGTAPRSGILTIENLARRGAVTQVGFQWLQPDGWSMNEDDTLDWLDGKEITSAEFMDHVSRNVHRARLYALRMWLIAATLLPVITLILGVGVAWVRGGFQESRRT